MEFEREMNLANEIHIFPSDSKIGIMFYDKTPSETEQKLTGTVPQGVYHTKENSIEEVEWDDEINSPNVTISVRYMNGTNTVTTYVVTPQKFAEILNTIKKSIEAKEEQIVVDTREKEKDEKSKRNIINEISHLDKYANIKDSEIKNIQKELTEKYIDINDISKGEK